MNGQRLLRLFESSGFSGLVGDEASELADYLERTAGTMPAPVFLAQAIRTVDALMREHDAYGGTRVGFLEYLDRVAVARFAAITRSPAHEAAELARDFRDEIVALVSEYDPGKTRGL